MRRALPVLVLAVAFVGAADGARTLALTSPALKAGGTFPRRFTCSGSDVSPPLRWTAPPAGTKSFALVMRDMSTSPVFVHWTAWGVAPKTRSLGSGADPRREGQNTFGMQGYGGPCPPPGQRHRYVFTLYALRTPLALSSGSGPS